MEAENQDLCNDLKSVQMAKTESERKRKQVEQQLQEATIKLQETERSRSEAADKSSKLSVSLLKHEHDKMKNLVLKDCRLFYKGIVCFLDSD